MGVFRNPRRWILSRARRFIGTAVPIHLLDSGASASPVSVTSITTNSVSPSGSTVILAAYIRTGAGTTLHPTVSGLGLKWTLLRFNNRSAVNLFYVWKGEGTATPGAVTITRAGTDTFVDWRYQLVDLQSYSDVVQYEIKDQSTANVNADIDAHFTSEATSIMLAFHSVRSSDYYFTNDDPDYTMLAETHTNGYGTIWGGYSEESETGSYGDWSSAVTSTKQNFVVECRQPSECPFTVLDSYGLVDAVTPTTADIVTQDSAILPGGDVCFFAIQIRYGTYTGNPTLTGCGYTWTIQEDTITSSLNRVIVFKGVAGTPSSGALTLALNGTDTWADYRYVVLEAPGYSIVVQSAENSLATAVTNNDLTFGFTTGATSLTLGFEALRGAEAYWTHDDADYRAINMTNTNDLGELVAYWSPNQESQMFGDWSTGAAYAKHAVAVEITYAVAIFKLVNETLNMVEGTVKTLGVLKLVNEALNLVEGTARLLGLHKVVNEALNIVEGTVKTLSFYVFKVVSEALNLVEGTAKGFGFNKVVNEALNLVESTVKVLGTIKIVTEVLNMIEGTVKLTAIYVETKRIFYETLQTTRSLAETGLKATRRFYEVIKTTRKLP